MGQVMKLDNRYDLKVTGIIKDPPPNTHLPFGFLVSFETVRSEIKPHELPFYAIMGGFTYFAAPENFELAKEARLPLQPLPDIH